MVAKGIIMPGVFVLIAVLSLAMPAIVARRRSGCGKALV